MNLRIHQFVPVSRANGPGARAVVWVQGCSLGCPGCFNPESHSFNQGEVVSVEDLFLRVATLPELEGVTVSGGEPLQQRDAITEFLRRIKSEMRLSVILFSGLRWDEINGLEVLRYTDVLLAGRYEQKQRIARRLLGSANKTVHFLTDRYTMTDLEAVAPAEVFLSSDGQISFSGIDPVQW